MCCGSPIKMTDPMHRYSDNDIAAVYRAISERRDMRHFLSDAVDPKILNRLLHAAHMAPSVGLMQPWRFIRITDPVLRQKIHSNVDNERIQTAKALKEREDDFMKLKVEGILECGELLVVSLTDKRELHVFGRRTLPEMDLASVACAIQNMWLAARAEGLGMGWVSMFDPDILGKLLNMPSGSRPIAIICLGHVEKFYEQPLLELEQWAHRFPTNEMIFENQWAE